MKHSVLLDLLGLPQEVHQQVAGVSVVQVLVLDALQHVLSWVTELFHYVYYLFLDYDVLFVILLLIELHHIFVCLLSIGQMSKLTWRSC
jgi:hypothetical protein